MSEIVETNDHSKLEQIGRMNETKAVLAELEYAGLVKCETRWSERNRQWEPMYALTELGRALSAAGISLDEYLSAQERFQ
jgi:hypothetical protein